MNYTKMATYIFCNAANNTITTNWRIFQIQLESEFDVTLTSEDIYKIVTALLVNFKNAILDVCVDKDENGYVIDFVLGSDYCLEITEEENV